jgi:hypothetical protein
MEHNSTHVHACGPPSQVTMLETNCPKLTLSSQEARDAVPLAIWTGEIAEALTDAEIAVMRAVSKDFNSIMSDGAMWMDKLTLLSLTHTGLSDLAKGEQETSYAWYTRCLGAARDGETLKRGSTSRTSSHTFKHSARSTAPSSRRSRRCASPSLGV